MSQGLEASWQQLCGNFFYSDYFTSIYKKEVITDETILCEIDQRNPILFWESFYDIVSCENLWNSKANFPCIFHSFKFFQPKNPKKIDTSHYLAWTGGFDLRCKKAMLPNHSLAVHACSLSSIINLDFMRETEFAHLFWTRKPFLLSTLWQLL